MTLRPIVVALAACAALAGCTEERVATGPDVAVTAVPSDAASKAASGARVVVPEGGLENPIPTAWTKAKVARDGLSARLTWYSGVEECYGLDHVDVDYTDTAVEVTLFSGSRPEAEACIDLAEKVVTVVDFEEPVGDREIVDASRPD